MTSPSNPKTVILLYDNCVLFEVTKTSMEMAKGSKVITASLDAPTPIKTLDGFIVSPHMKLEDIPVNEIDCMVITGGYPTVLINHPKWEILRNLLIELNKKSRLIGGICGGVFPIVASGILEGKSFTGDIKDFKEHQKLLEKTEYIDASIVINGNIVTAKDNAEIEFAVKLAEISGFYKSNNAMTQSLEHYKNREAKIIHNLA